MNLKSKFIRNIARFLPAPVKLRLRRLKAKIESIDNVTQRDISWRPDIEIDKPVRMIIGPANFAGQAEQWVRASERFIPGVVGISMARRQDLFNFQSDYEVATEVYRNADWSKRQETWIQESFTHVLVDGMRPILGPRASNDCRKEIPLLLESGLEVGLIAHGSEIRIPSLHADLYPTSPFRDVPEEFKKQVAVMEGNSQVFNKFFNEFPGPKFVSTVDLLDFAPQATYLPTVVNPNDWATKSRISLSTKPTVLHLPSNGLLKGSHLVDPVLNQLSEKGLIHYLRPDHVAPDRVAELIWSADIVVEQVVLGLYSVMAIQSMAAGRLTIAHVPEHVRAKIPVPGIPLVDASSENLAETILNVISNASDYENLASQGPAFVTALHDGQASADALAKFLGVE